MNLVQLFTSLFEFCTLSNAEVREEEAESCEEEEVMVVVVVVSCSLTKRFAHIGLTTPYHHPCHLYHHLHHRHRHPPPPR